MAPRHYKWALLGLAGAIQIAIRSAGSVDAFLAWVPMRCPLRMFTGIECPTCGLGHAIVEALAGEWAASWRHHPAGIVLVLLLIATAAMPRAVGAAAARARGLAQHRGAAFAALAAYALWGFARG